MKKINADYKYLIITWGLLILAIIPSFAHHGSLIVDCGREVYYPTQILLGKILYKDIFNIYGPFSYMFNAILFKIFGINLNVFYLTGCVCAFFITSLTYLIARRFLGEFLSFSICALIIFLGVFNTNIFNFIFPYSYAIVYGTVSVLLSIWLLLKYEENPEKTIYLYFSGLSAGLCVANKYEFLPFFLVIFYAAFKVKSLNLKQYGLLILSLLFIPSVNFAILFIQGLRINDLIKTGIIINKMAHTQTLKYFYSKTGVFFHKSTIPFMSSKIIITTILLTLLSFAMTRKNKFLMGLLTIISMYLIICNTRIDSFMFLPILVVFLFILNFKNTRNNTKLMILTLSSILLDMKFFWGLLAFSYGSYWINLQLITAIALIIDKFKNKKINQQIISVYLITATIALSSISQNYLKEKPLFLSTPKGNFYPEAYYIKSTETLMKYIQTNTKKTDTIVILPEGQLINFLTDRKSDDTYGSLIPLYVETFGEDNIIQHFKQTKPEYIIFNNWDNYVYYFRYICNDYALGFCSFVAQNYSREKVIDNDGFRYLIFKLKK